MEDVELTEPWETYQWLDGPKLYNWLLQQGIIPSVQNPTGTNNGIRKWKPGELVYYARIDALLNRQGLGFFDIPDEIWVKEHPHKAMNSPRRHLQLVHL